MMELRSAVGIVLVMLVGAAFGGEAPVLTEKSTAEDVLVACRRMLPVKPVCLEGALIRRTKRGIVKNEYDYTLDMDRRVGKGQVTVEVRERGTTNIVVRKVLTLAGASVEGNVAETDVTWLDLSLDYLWWRNVAFEADKEGETVHGQTCAVILVKPPQAIKGVSAVRLWADRKTGCLMQAEQLDAEGKACRRMWGSRVKKFGERWMANVMEVEVPGTGMRTKITVETLEEGA